MFPHLPQPEPPPSPKPEGLQELNLDDKQLVSYGLAQLEAMLRHYAQFSVWLALHDRV